MIESNKLQILHVNYVVQCRKRYTMGNYYRAISIIVWLWMVMLAYAELKCKYSDVRTRNKIKFDSCYNNSMPKLQIYYIQYNLI